MDIKFKEHFSENSEDYSKYRPQYPDELFSYLSSITQDHQRAWDCATGTGQSALSLSNYYSEVIGTDASEAQIAKAINNENITYLVAPAESTNIQTNSVDLVTVAQALHWFDIDAFAREVSRVLKHQGLLAVWTYNLLQIQPDIDKAINHLYKTVLDDYWPKERALVEEGYGSIQLPFNEIQAPAFHMSTKWDISHLFGYLGTWSAVRKYQKETGKNPLETCHDELLSLWGSPERLLPVIWPLSIRLWLKTV